MDNRTPEQRYAEKVRVLGIDECWPWLACRNSAGYGMFRWPGGQLAHRFAYETFVGPIGDLHVCHTCDKPECQNPRHLFLGTPADNSNDKVTKGRQSRTPLAGERNPRARLNASQIEEVRRRYEGGEPAVDLAAAYGVSARHVRNVARGRRWQDGSAPLPAQRLRGARHHSARLTEQSAAEVRRRYLAGGITQTQLAAEYGISQSSISKVIRNASWSTDQPSQRGSRSS